MHARTMRTQCTHNAHTRLPHLPQELKALWVCAEAHPVPPVVWDRRCWQGPKRWWSVGVGWGAVRQQGQQEGGV